MATPLILVAPGLLTQPPDSLARVASLQTLARLATVQLEAEGMNAAVIGTLGMRRDTPIGPLLARGAGADIGPDYVIVADPVFLAADRDDLVLVDRVDDLTADETDALAAMLNRHFAADGMQLGVTHSATWLARVNHVPALQTTPLDIARGRGLLPHLPTGPDARTWTRWQNEIQMLLHDHPVNIAREARGCLPVTGVWFWGGGTADAIGALPRISAMTARTRIGDIARAVGELGGGTHRDFGADETLQNVVASFDGSGPTIVVLGHIDNESAMAQFEAGWLTPAVKLLAQRAVDPLHLIADGNGNAARWTARPPTPWQRIATLRRHTAFTVPGNN